jgi:prophage antirepressor-like protein
MTKKVYHLVKDIDNIHSRLPTQISIINKTKNVANINMDIVSKVRIYGKPDSPRYHLGDISTLLGIPDAMDRIKEFDSDEVEYATVINSSNKKPKRKYLLTDDGLQRITYLSNTPLGKLFRKAVKYILKQLFLEGKVESKEITKHLESKHHDLCQQSIESLYNNIEELKKSRKAIKERMILYIEAEENSRNKVDELQDKLVEVTNEKYQSIQELTKLKEDYEKLQCEANKNYDYINSSEIGALQKKYYKKIYIYLEDISKMEIWCKNKCVEKYDIDDYIYDKPDPSDVKIYSIQNRKSIKKTQILVETLYSMSDVYAILYKNLYNDIYSVSVYKKEYLLCSIEDIKLEFEDIIIKQKNNK